MDDKPAFHPDSYDEPDAAGPPPPAPPRRTADLDSYQPEAKPPPLKEPPVGPTYHQPARKKQTIIMTAIFGLIILSIGGYYAYSKLRGTPAAPPSNSSTGTRAAEKSSPTLAITTKTKSYTSPNFNLALSYPEDWTVVDDGGGTMTIKSPNLGLKNASGQQVSGQVVLTIRNGAQKMTEFDKGNATAVQESKKVSYNKPTQTQRGSTYLSYLRFAVSAAGLDGIYITGDNGYQKGQAIPLVDITKVDPKISLTFFDAAGKPLTLAETLLAQADFTGPLEAILKSLSIN